MLVGTTGPPPALKTPGLHQPAQGPVKGITYDHRFLTVSQNLLSNLKPATLGNSSLPEPPHRRQHPNHPATRTKFNRRHTAAPALRHLSHAVLELWYHLRQHCCLGA